MLLSFDPSEFERDAFDADAFVAQCLRNSCSSLALKNLRRDLDVHADALKTRLIDLLNKEYADFIALSSNLEGTTASVDAITRDLQRVRTRVAGAYDATAAAVAAVAARQQGRRVVHNRRVRLHQLVTMRDDATRIQTLLADARRETAPASSSSSSRDNGDDDDVDDAEDDNGGGNDDCGNHYADLIGGDRVFKVYQQQLLAQRSRLAGTFVCQSPAERAKRAGGLVSLLFSVFSLFSLSLSVSFVSCLCHV
jgi:hypothetical protein